MDWRGVAENTIKFFVLAGAILVGCIAENPVITGTSTPQITSLPDGQEFVRSQNTWIANKGFSSLSLVTSWQKWLDYKKVKGIHMSIIPITVRGQAIVHFFKFL